MYVYVIADKVTGEIIHCMTDTGDGKNYEDNLAKGIPPMQYENGMPDTEFAASIKQERLPKDVAEDPKDFRETFRVRPSTAKGGKPDFAIEKRAVRGKINEITGRIIDDPTKYDEIIAATKAEYAAREAVLK
jgi:hypothetical protein